MTLKADDIYVADDFAIIPAHAPDRILGWTEALRSSDDWIEIVPAIDTIAVSFDPLKTDLELLPELIITQVSNASHSPSAELPVAHIPICYAAELGLDQQYIADCLGLEPSELPEWHCSQSFNVAMLGFLPGFAYLRGDQSQPDIPRLQVPRQSVSAGSVGVLGKQTGLYPIASPGGWPIIGVTPVTLFDAKENNPALLSAGQKVRFHPIALEEYETTLSATLS